jgi:hypothetical protein
VFTAGLFTALSAVMLFAISVELGATRGGALFGALTYGLATPIWPLATLFIGHAFSAACLVFAFAAATRIGNARLKPSRYEESCDGLCQTSVARGFSRAIGSTTHQSNGRCRLRALSYSSRASRTVFSVDVSATGTSHHDS